jgi:hypothetical protein
VRDLLDGATEVIALAFAVQHAAINLAGGH